METYLTFSLALAAFWLGACPFAVWIGQYLVKRDIRKYGDSNPGTANVFRAGGIRWGILALVLEMGKGYPFVFLAYSYFHLGPVLVIIIILSAILGHAFSPILRFHGGKALAVTGGALLALPPYQIFICILLMMAIFYIFVKQDAWTVLLSFLCGFIFFLLLTGLSWQTVLILCITLILAIKHKTDLRSLPSIYIKPLHWHRLRKET
ncbi:MAG TPA: glycerol-3-phosphate acyltransferase [Dehalococcoidia bacterium]|nr:glycerol-3-phosphate acyltransferase [Dehalococcoidia bacterium]